MSNTNDTSTQSIPLNQLPQTTVVSTPATVSQVERVISQDAEDLEPDPKSELINLDKPSHDIQIGSNESTTYKNGTNNQKQKTDDTNVAQNQYHEMQNLMQERTKASESRKEEQIEHKSTQNTDHFTETSNLKLVDSVQDQVSPRATADANPEQSKNATAISSNPCAPTLATDQGRQDTQGTNQPQEFTPSNSNLLSQTSVDPQMEKVIDDIVELTGDQQFSQTLSQPEDKDKAVDKIHREIISGRNPMDIIADIASRQEFLVEEVVDQATTERMVLSEENTKTTSPDQSNDLKADTEQSNVPATDSVVTELIPVGYKMPDIATTHGKSLTDILHPRHTDLTESSTVSSEDEIIIQSSEVQDIAMENTELPVEKRRDDVLQHSSSPVVTEVVANTTHSVSDSPKKNKICTSQLSPDPCGEVDNHEKLIESTDMTSQMVADTLSELDPEISQSFSKQAKAVENDDTDDIEVTTLIETQDTKSCEFLDHEQSVRRSGRKAKPKVSSLDDVPVTETKRPVGRPKGAKGRKSVTKQDEKTEEKVTNIHAELKIGDLAPDMSDIKHDENLEREVVDSMTQKHVAEVETKKDDHVEPEPEPSQEIEQKPVEKKKGRGRPPKKRKVVEEELIDESNVEQEKQVVEKCFEGEPVDKKKDMEKHVEEKVLEETLEEPDKTSRVMRRTRTPKRPLEEEPSQPETTKKPAKRSRRSHEEHNKSYDNIKSTPTIKLTIRSRATISTANPATSRADERRDLYEYDSITGSNKKYQCDKCRYSTERLNNIVFHHKSTSSVSGYKCLGAHKLEEARKADIIRIQQTPKGNKKRLFR